jgi:hypothetical protein
MNHVIATLIICLAALSATLDAAPEESEPDSSTRLPDTYAKNYLVAASTLSPDKQFAVNYPKRNTEEFPEGKDYIVSLQPFAVIGSLETKWPYFQHENRGGISAKWSGDSSVALVTLDSRWVRATSSYWNSAAKSWSG